MPVPHSSETTDSLSSSNILGRWEIRSRSINNISDMTVQCCEIYQFDSGNTPNDFSGNVMFSQNGVNLDGHFTLNEMDSTIDFTINGINRIFKFSTTDEGLTLKYELDGDFYLEKWQKVQ